jgi:hypothetical protein
MKFKNTGNTILQPQGNIFIQRSLNSKSSINVINVNPQSGYILPGTDRLISSQWANGFPAYQTVITPSGSSKTTLNWNWSKLSTIRIGRYVGSLVAVYNNGLHDVPLQANVSFWVIPWKLLIVLLILAILIIIGLWTIISKSVSVIRKKRKNQGKTKTP